MTFTVVVLSLLKQMSTQSGYCIKYIFLDISFIHKVFMPIEIYKPLPLSNIKSETSAIKIWTSSTYT